MSKTIVTMLMVVIVLSISVLSWSAPMGTAFTYQGRLSDGGAPAEGQYDFEFKLYDDPCTGTQQGSTVSKDNVDVSDGFFIKPTATIDEGSTRAPGSNRSASWSTFTGR